MTKLESKLQAECKEIVETHGGKMFKWVSPGQLGVPDSIALVPGHPPIFIEFKREKRGVVSGMQGHLMSWMQEHGFEVWLVRSAEDLANALRGLHAIRR